MRTIRSRLPGWLALAVTGPVLLTACGSAPQDVPTIPNNTVSASATAPVTGSPSAPPSGDPSGADSPATPSGTPGANLAFRSINLSELCGTDGAHSLDCIGQYGDGSIQVNSRIFQYEAAPDGSTSPHWARVVENVQVACESINLNFAVQDDSPDGTTANVRVVQVAVDPIMSSAARGKVGSLSAPLTGSEFAIQANSSNGTPVRLSGTAMCRV